MQAKKKEKKKKSPTSKANSTSLLPVPVHLKTPKAKEKLSYCTDGYDCMPMDSIQH